MLYSFARNRGIPAHLFFSRVSRLTHTPLRTIWLLTACAFLLGLPLLKSAVAFAAVVSITSIGLLVSYAIPMVCKLTLSRRRFVPGPFSLGRYSELVGWLAVGWMVLASVCPARGPCLWQNGCMLGCQFEAACGSPQQQPDHVAGRCRQADAGRQMLHRRSRHADALTCC